MSNAVAPGRSDSNWFVSLELLVAQLSRASFHSQTSQRSLPTNDRAFVNRAPSLPLTAFSCVALSRAASRLRVVRAGDLVAPHHIPPQIWA
jgi:hypothetical protein